MALIASAYGWSPAQLRELTDAEAAYYSKHLPLIEARRHFPIARLTADLREFIMPRYTEPDPDERQPAKPPRARDPWKPTELLPWYASFGEDDMTTEQAQSLVEAFDSLPEWARAVAPIAEARELLRASQGQPEPPSPR